MKRLQEWCRPGTAVGGEHRRGAAHQRPQRRREHDLRGHVVAFTDWAAARGWTQVATAALLQLAPRTLRLWQHEARADPGLAFLGRPVLRAPRPERQAVLELLAELGPGIGLPTLRGCFPTLARAELDDLLRRYRQVWRLRQRQAVYVLHWPQPGRVWAADFAEPPAPLDGLYAALLAVRDLASGQQLLWLPLAEATSAQTVGALAWLFAVHGAPLVLKSDNGSPFTAAATQALLAGAGVVALLSPPYWPQYNGAIEAGIGSLKTRTDGQAARHGRLGHWSCDDVAAAQAEANATARPRGPAGPTPAQAWAARRPVTALERGLFRASVARLRLEARSPLGLPGEGPLSASDERAVERRAIRRALEEHGYLLYSRRRIPLPIPKRKAAKIT